jgi:hypothetical protein
MYVMRESCTQPSSSGLAGRSSTPRLLDSILGVSGILGPRFRGDDTLRSSLPPRIRSSSSGLAGRSSTLRLLDSISGASGIPDPRFRGDDRLSGDDRSRSSLPPQTHLSSSGLTGRSSTPRLLDSISGVSGILDPRFRGDDRLSGDDTLRSSLPPQIRPSSPRLTGRSSTPRLLDSISGVSGRLGPRFRGMTGWCAVTAWYAQTMEN